MRFTLQCSSKTIHLIRALPCVVFRLLIHKMRNVCEPHEVPLINFILYWGVLAVRVRSNDVQRRSAVKYNNSIPTSAPGCCQTKSAILGTDPRMSNKLPELIHCPIRMQTP